jgi:hypothetical protein
VAEEFWATPVHVYSRVLEALTRSSPDKGLVASPPTPPPMLCCLDVVSQTEHGPITRALSHGQQRSS